MNVNAIDPDGGENGHEPFPLGKRVEIEAQALALAHPLQRDERASMRLQEEYLHIAREAPCEIIDVPRDAARIAMGNEEDPGLRGAPQAIETRQRWFNHSGIYPPGLPRNLRATPLRPSRFHSRRRRARRLFPARGANSRASSRNPTRSQLPGLWVRTSCGRGASLANKPGNRMRPSVAHQPAECQALGSAVVGIGKGLLKVRPFAVDPPLPFLHGSAIGESPEGPGPMVHRIVSRRRSLALVPRDQLGDRLVARRVLPGHDPVRAAVEPGEVIEAQRLAVDPIARGPAARHAARGEVPGRHVVARGSDDGDAVEEDGGEVQPLLVGEQAVRDIRPAELIGPVRPPVEEASALGGIAHADEPQVEDTPLQAADLVVDDRFVALLGRRLVRCQRDVRLVQAAQDVVDSRKQDHVRVEVKGALAVCPPEEVLEHERLDGRGELDDVVPEGPRTPVRNAQRGDLDDVVERLVPRPSATRGARPQAQDG